MRGSPRCASLPRGRPCRFRALSAPAQLIAMEIAAWNGTRTELGRWSALAAANNLSMTDAK